MAIIKNPFMVVGDKNPLIANNEDELNALLTSKNAGKAVLYSGELYIVEGGEATENPTAVQLYTTPAGVPLSADTEEKANALLVENNVGKIFKYASESVSAYEKDALYLIAGGGAGNAPIAVGDKLSAIYFDTSKTPNFDALSYEYDETSDGMRTRSTTILNLASYESALIINRMSGDNGHAEIIASGSMQFYINGEGNVGGMEMTPETFGLTAFGWQTDTFDMSDTSQSEYSDTTVNAVTQQDIWGSYISKEPFGAGAIAAKKLQIAE